MRSGRTFQSSLKNPLNSVVRQSRDLQFDSIVVAEESRILRIPDIETLRDAFNRAGEIDQQVSRCRLIVGRQTGNGDIVDVRRPPLRRRPGGLRRDIGIVPSNRFARSAIRRRL